MDRLLDIVSEKLIVRFKLKGNEDTDHIEGIRSLSSGIGYRFISKEVKDQKDIDFLLGLKEEDITTSMIMELFGDFKNHQKRKRFHTGIHSKQNRSIFSIGFQMGK